MGYISKVYTGSITHSLAHYTAGRVDMLWVRKAIFCFPVALVSNKSFYPDLWLQRLIFFFFFTLSKCCSLDIFHILHHPL